MDWEFWIDVGGTFTDCFARHRDGRLLRAKILSSGVTKGTVQVGSTRESIVDPGRQRDPIGFWTGYKLWLLNESNDIEHESVVEHFDATAGALKLATPLEKTPLAGMRYELSSGGEAPIVAVRYLLGLTLEQSIPPISLRLGTTRGTNALLTRRGARTAFVTTRGFADVLLIGYQQRPKLFALDIEKPTPLFSATLEIDERVLADGTMRRAPNKAMVHEQLLALRDAGIESVAICLLHADRFPAHEQIVERIAREVGFTELSVSHEVAPLVKIVARGDTTLVDAYLNPVLRRYVASLESALPGSRIRLMTSAGGLVAPEAFRGKDSILSGPAGGVVGFAEAAAQAGFSRAIGFDMGGTSTDVARFEGRFEREYETEKAGVRVVAPMMAIHTVAAGGGSICAFDGTRLLVGPASAGADPGPACYGRGGPLTVTDVNLFLGRIPVERFPFPLDRDAVTRRLLEIQQRMMAALGDAPALEMIAAGFVTVANHHMARAIRTISVARGYDPRDYVLVAFGAAAAQHACAVARELGVRQVLSHPDAGLLSAYGIGQASLERHDTLGVYQPLRAETLNTIQDELERRKEVLVEALRAQENVRPDTCELAETFELRYCGYDATLLVAAQPTEQALTQAFQAAHQRAYGYTHAGREIELVAVHLAAASRRAEMPLRSTRAPSLKPTASGEINAYFETWRATPWFDRETLVPGTTINGPAILAERHATTVIEPGWTAEMLSVGEIVLTDLRSPAAGPVEPEASAPGVNAQARDESSHLPDAVMLEVFNQQFAGIAEQMGVTLRNTATSVNVKERLDFSCAVFDAAGDLIVNAPHIPVHLGAMSETIRRVISDNPEMRAGDVHVTNDPYRGGSHLPDVTVVTPVHDTASGELLFFTGSRAHHAEIGGITPGSMPPFSKNLAEEGVLLRNIKLIDAGSERFEAVEDALRTARYPSRNVAENLADLRAQVAANHFGAQALRELVARYTWPSVRQAMRGIQQAAERKLREALARLPEGKRTFTDHLDDGTPITVAVTIREQKIEFDFTGTGSVLPGNLNANRAIVTAAVMYCLRVLIDEEIPLNAGVLAPVRIVLPECLLNPPAHDAPEECAAIVGGNVETSQRVVDVLLGALGLCAASQGTMNNLLFGDGTFGYYETLCGGAGATPRAPGADAVHTHMTNTRLTDPEVLERRYPVELREFRIRRESGGRGLHRGGDGVVRRIEFLRPLTLSLLTQRRGAHMPYGAAGGQSGVAGKNTLTRANGEVVSLESLAQVAVQPGDVLTIETPGGGAWGEE